MQQLTNNVKRCSKCEETPIELGQKPSIDHIVPITRGGTHTWDNAQLAHLLCNTRKGNKVLEPNTRVWI